MVDISEMLKYFTPISLEEMGKVRLMNRIDTKFTTHREKLATLLQQMMNNYFVQEIKSSRVSRYQTVYYDTATLAMYMAHQNGRRTREKIRVRKYADTGQIFLEIKNKNNKGRTLKNRIPVRDIKDFHSETTDMFICGQSRFVSGEISPCLETVFNRITLVNHQMTERLTIDLNLAFHNYNTQLSQLLEDVVIIELKQDGNLPSPARKLLAKEHILPVSISKYCLGSVLTNPDLKYNRFKCKLIQINKITNYQYGYIS